MLNSANVRANNDHRRPTEPHRYLLCGAGPGANSTSRQVQSIRDSRRRLWGMFGVGGNWVLPAYAATAGEKSSFTTRLEPAR
jgi:hypothetical protein